MGDSPEVTYGLSAGATISNVSDAAEDDVIADEVPPELPAPSAPPSALAIVISSISSVADTSPANQAHSVNTSGPSRVGSEHGSGVALRGDGAAPATRLPADPDPLDSTGFSATSAHLPGATSTVDADTGWVTGWVFAEDPDDDRVTYSGTGPTRKGDVIVYEDASFLYKPTLAARRLAAAIGGDRDTFTIKVRDARGRGRIIPVTVEVLPAA